MTSRSAASATLCDGLAHRGGDAQVALLLQLAEQPPVQCVEREVPDRLVVQRLDQLQPPGLCERLAHERTRPDRESIAGAQFNGVGGALAGLLAAPAVKLAPDEPPRFDRACGWAGQRAEVVVARLAQRGLDFVAERSLGEFFLGSLRLHHEAAVVAAVLRPDEERDQTGQDHALEQVVALHGGEHACRVLARENLAAEAVAPADERSDALGGQQREAHAPHRDRAVLRAPGAVGPRQPEGRVGDDLRDLHAQLAQHRKGALHVACDRVIVAGSHLIAVDLHAEALIARPGRKQRAIAGGGVEHGQAPQRVDRLLDERRDLGRRVELLQPAHVTEASGAEHAAGGIERFIRQSTAEQLAALAALGGSCDRNRLRHGRPFARAPPRVGPMPDARHAQRACENRAGMAARGSCGSPFSSARAAPD